MFLSAEENFYRITFGGNFKNIPFETFKTNSNTNKPLGLKLNNWVFSPSAFDFINDRNKSGYSKNIDTKNFLFIKFNTKF
jgi:hypothetical protein